MSGFWRGSWGAPLDPPKHAEFHLAKRLLKEAEELPARGSMSSLRKTWGAVQNVKVVKKGKELKSRGGPSAKQPAKTEEAWSRADVLAQDFYGLDAARRREICHRRCGAVRREIQELAQAAIHNDATQALPPQTLRFGVGRILRSAGRGFLNAPQV